MLSSPWTNRRLLIPRWRSLSLSIATKELAHPRSVSDSAHLQSDSQDLIDKLIAWELDPNVVTAGELLGASLVEGKSSKLRQVAEFLGSENSTATSSLRTLANRALQQTEEESSFSQEPIANIQQIKRQWRRRTRTYRDNALAWVELSLLDLIGGKKKSSKRSMLVALSLAPSNRHVLRSASRLFIHLDDVERAYDLVAKCDATKSDPWLIAAEISIANLVDRNARYFAQGRRIVKNAGLDPRQISELAGALATLELEAGRHRKARKYFRQSVLDPTGNALAQAEWASPSFNYQLITNWKTAIQSEGFEANVLRLLHREHFSRASYLCLLWWKTEPYSVRPLEIASSSTSVTSDHLRSIEIVEKGLKIRSDSSVLLNNYAFALAHLGRFKEANQVLRRINKDNSNSWFISEANRGLLAMRQGKHDSGLAYYRNAIDGFRTLRERRLADVARIYLARESSLVSSPQAKQLLQEAREARKRLNTATHDHVLMEAEQALGL